MLTCRPAGRTIVRQLAGCMASMRQRALRRPPVFRVPAPAKTLEWKLVQQSLSLIKVRFLVVGAATLVASATESADLR